MGPGGSRQVVTQRSRDREPRGDSRAVPAIAASIG
jgi:hypothetical protein